jgi:protein TonB
MPKVELTPKPLPEKLAALGAPSILEEEDEFLEQENTEDTSPVETGISADFPDFPYPWYITQVRVSLWNEWSSRMPRSGDISAGIVFTIKRDGTIKKTKVENKSGNKLFDFAAISSVEQATPFPPLPKGYTKKDLVVHVEFKIEK